MNNSKNINAKIYDSLTGAFSRELFDQLLEKEFIKAERFGLPL